MMMPLSNNSFVTMALQATQQACVNEAIVNVLPPPKIVSPHRIVPTPVLGGADPKLFHGRHRNRNRNRHRRHMLQDDTNVTWTQRGNDILGLQTGNQSGNTIALSRHATFMAISERFHEPDEDPNTYDYGLTRVFEFNGLDMAWRQRGEGIYASMAGDEGKSVALSADGSILAIGSTKSENQEGMARVFYWDGSSWVEQGGGFPGPYAGSHKGYSIALSKDGHSIATGAPDIESGGRGWFLLYYRNGVGAAWSPRGSATYGINNGDEFGAALSLSSDGNVIAVGAPGYNEDTGQAVVYKWTSSWFSPSSWKKRGSPIVGTASPGRRVGEFIDLSADASVIAVSETNLCHVYEWANGTSWQPRGSAIDVETDVISSVAISSDGNVVALGLVSTDAARIFEWDGASWSQRVATFVANEIGPNSVALSYDGDIVAVGSKMSSLEDTRALPSGASESSGLVQVFSDETLPGETSAWDIIFLDTKVDFSQDSSDELILSYDVSKYRPIQATLYHHDCFTEITDIEINRTIFNTPTENLQDFLTLNYSIDKSGIKSSAIWNAAENRIELCQIVQLINPLDDEDTYMVISSDKRKLTISFDLSVDFTVNGTALEGATVLEANQNVTFDDYITAYKCEGLGKNGTTDVLLQNTQLIICIKSSSPDVQIDSISSMIINGIGLNAEDRTLPVVEDAEPTYPAFTYFEYETDRSEVAVSTRVPSNVFSFEADAASISISGGVLLKLADSTTGRKLMASRLLQGASEEASFELDINLQPERTAITEETAIMSSAMATASQTNCFVLLFTTILFAYYNW